MNQPYKYFLSAILFVLSSIIAKAQVDVTSSGGVTIESYPTLKRAFDSINVGRHTGTIAIGISGNTNENAAAVLNASGVGAASYTGITISPTGAGSRTITGSLPSSSGFNSIIVLNGADNVTINGSNGTTANTNCPLSAATRNLSIIRSNASGFSLPGIIGLHSNANNNKVINCNIVGYFNSFSFDFETVFGINNVGSDNNQFINNHIEITHYGINSFGDSENKNTGTIIAQNDISPGTIGGIVVSYEDGIIISGNKIAQIGSNFSPITSGVFGIDCQFEVSNFPNFLHHRHPK